MIQHNGTQHQILKPDAIEIQEMLDALFPNGEPFEIRVLKLRKQTPDGLIDDPFAKAMSGVYTSTTLAASHAAKYSGQHCAGVYVTVNQLSPDVLSRGASRIAKGKATADADIVRYRHLFIDFDPKRLSDTNATASERTAARERAARLLAYLRDIGWPEPAWAGSSGSGSLLLYRIDLAPDAHPLIKRVLQGLSDLFGDDEVTIDTSVHNPARIVRLAGTVNAKAIVPQPERPWRLAAGKATSNPGIVSREQLESVAADEPNPARRVSVTGDAYDLRAILSDSGIQYREKIREYGTAFKIDDCLTSSDHEDGAVFIQFHSGAVAYRCLHDRCAGKGWRDVKQLLNMPTRPSEPTHVDDGALRTFTITDTGNAERLVARFGQDLRYNWSRGAWCVWTGTHWGDDVAGRLEQLAKATARGIPNEAAELSGDAYTKHLRWAATSESASKRASMIECARSEDGIPILADQLDRDPWTFNAANGTLDLQTGQARPHNRRDLLSKVAPVAYDPDATCPRFLEWLHQIMLGRHDLVTFLQRAMGYSLTGNISERLVFILHGGGRNGKTTLLETMGGILGDYAGIAPAEMLLAKRGDAGIPNDLARLPGTRFVSATETGQGRRLDEVKIKSITGGDTISARFMREEFFDFRPTFKIWLGTNHKPEIHGTDNAIWDRIRLIPFDYRVADDQKIPDLSDIFVAEEGPGILAWTVQGCLDWQRDGLTMPSDVLEANTKYRHDMDPLSNWIEDRCELRPGAREAAKTLFADYVSYCEQAGEEPLKQRTFGVRITGRGCGEAKSGGTRYRTGIRLRDPNDPVQTTFAPSDTSHSEAAHLITSHEKAYESGGFQDSGNGRDVRNTNSGMNTREKCLRVDTGTSVPYVPSVPNDDPAELLDDTDETWVSYPGVAGDDWFTA